MKTPDSSKSLCINFRCCQAMLRATQQRGRANIKNAFLNKSSASTLNSRAGVFQKFTGSGTVGSFGRDEFKSSRSIVKAADQCREDSYRLMENVINVEPGMKTVQAVDELSNCLCSIADPANFLSFK